MTEQIVITHVCDLCSKKVNTHAKDRIIGHVSKGHPENWEEIKGDWCCSSCAEGWHKRESQAWKKYKEERKSQKA